MQFNHTGTLRDSGIYYIPPTIDEDLCQKKNYFFNFSGKKSRKIAFRFCEIIFFTNFKYELEITQKQLLASQRVRKHLGIKIYKIDIYAKKNFYVKLCLTFYNFTLNMLYFSS